MLVVDLTLDSTLAAVIERGTGEVTTVRLGSDGSAFTVAFAPAEGIPRRILLNQLRASSDVVLLLGRLDPGLGAVPLIEWATGAVAFVTSGRSTATSMRSAAHLLRAAGLRFQSVLVVGADTNDDSIGLTDRPSQQLSDPAPSAWTSL